MSSFQYSMENILNYRKEKEEIAKEEFAQVQKEYFSQRNFLKNLEEKLENAINDFLRNGKNLKNSMEFKKVQQYLLFLQKKIEMQIQLVIKAEEKLERKRQQLLLTQRDREIIEKHREKSFKRYLLEEKQKEQKFIDELALYAYMRK